MQLDDKLIQLVFQAPKKSAAHMWTAPIRIDPLVKGLRRKRQPNRIPEQGEPIRVRTIFCF